MSTLQGKKDKNGDMTDLHLMTYNNDGSIVIIVAVVTLRFNRRPEFLASLAVVRGLAIVEAFVFGMEKGACFLFN